MIRKATLKDALSIQLLISTGEYEGVLLYRSLSEIKKLISNFIICEEKGQIVGCIGLDQYTKRIGELRSLYVIPEYRRKGIASLLIESALKRAKELGIYEIITISDKEEIFKKCGFKEKIGKQKALFLRFDNKNKNIL